MAHDRAAAVTATATMRAGPPLLVARNLLPSSASSVSVSASVESSSSSSSSAMGHGGARRRDRKYVGDDRVATATSSSTLSTTSSVDASAASSAAEAARRGRRHTHHSQAEQADKAARRRGASSPHRHRRPRGRDAPSVSSDVAVAKDIGPEKFAAKVLAQDRTAVATTTSPPASPEHYSSSSSGGPGSDKEDAAAVERQQQQQQQASKPSRMVVKRRTTSPATGSRPRAAAEPVAGAASTPATVPSSPLRQPRTALGSPSPGGGGVIERWQLRLKRSMSGGGGGTDDSDRRAREPTTTTRHLYSNHRSRQLMESPPPPDQVASTSRRRGSDSPGAEQQQRPRVRSSSRGARQRPLSAGDSGAAMTPPPPPASPGTPTASTPRTQARKVLRPAENEADGEGEAAAAPAARPIRVRYETPARGMGGGKREISHASLGKLVARLTDAHQYDTEFRDVFLLMYRGFCSPYDLVKKLLKRYTAVLSLCGGVDAEALEETQRLLDQIALEEESEQRSSTATSISTARSDINTGMEANVSIMRLLSVLKFWIKESGFIEQDLAGDRKAQKKLLAFLGEIHDTSPIPSIRRHADNLLLTVVQLLSAQKQQQAQTPPVLVTSSSVSALPDSMGSRGGDLPPPAATAAALAMAHQLSDRGASHSRMRAQAASKLQLSRSSSDPKRERGVVKLRTKNPNGDIFQLRSRSIPAGAEDHAAAAAATRDRAMRQQPAAAAAVAPKIARGITTGSAEAAVKATTSGGFDEIIQDTLQRARLTAASRSSARISYDNVEPLAGLGAQELADQLTLMEADQYFAKLNARELTNKAWTRESKHREAPHVMALIELFDATAEWVSSEILHPQLQAVERAKIITLFVDAADNCYQMNNFNTLFEITTGLSAPCIRQLNTTWGLVGAAALEKYQCLQQVCSPDDNYRSYRQAFALAEGQPRLACWFILVKDLFACEEAMKSTEDGLVNWLKFRKIYRIISEALDRQNFNYVPASGGSSSNMAVGGSGGVSGGAANGLSASGVSRKGRGILRHDRKTQIHIRHRLDTIRKDSSVLYQLARNANTQESILFVNSLSEAGFL